MSTATRFKYIRPFPFCVADQSAYFSGGRFDYVGNLTLTQVMAFYWNLETFTITTTGFASSDNTTSCGGLIVLFPVSSSAPFDQGGAEGVWYGEVVAPTAFGSFSALTSPRERVCTPGSLDYAHGFFAGLSGEDSGNIANNFSLSFAISTDPDNTGKYRLYYNLRIDYEDDSPPEGGPLIRFYNPNEDSGTVLASGTFTIGGITMNWECSDFGTSGSHSGLGLSATSSDYTYP